LTGHAEFQPSAGDFPKFQAFSVASRELASGRVAYDKARLQP
jgi:hypothetical protein